MDTIRGCYHEIKQNILQKLQNKSSIKLEIIKQVDGLPDEKLRAIYRDEKWIFPDYKPLYGDLMEITRQELKNTLLEELR